MIHLKVWSGWLQPSPSRILLKDNGVWLVLYIVNTRPQQQVARQMFSTKWAFGGAVVRASAFHL
jgi:hypothetical protein